MQINKNHPIAKRWLLNKLPEQNSPEWLDCEIQDAEAAWDFTKQIRDQARHDISELNRLLQIVIQSGDSHESGTASMLYYMLNPD